MFLNIVYVQISVRSDSPFFLFFLWPLLLSQAAPPPSVSLQLFAASVYFLTSKLHIHFCVSPSTVSLLPSTASAPAPRKTRSPASLILVAASHTPSLPCGPLPMLSPASNPRSSFPDVLQSFLQLFTIISHIKCLWISIFSFFFSGIPFLFSASESLYCCMPGGEASECCKAVSCSQVWCPASCQQLLQVFPGSIYSLNNTKSYVRNRFRE